MHKIGKRTPKGAQITFKSLKQKLTGRRTKNKRCRSRFWLQFGSASTLFFSSFFYFSLISLNARRWNPSLRLPHTYLQQMRGLGVMTARPGELLLHLEVSQLAQASWLLYHEVIWWPRRARGQPGQARVQKKTYNDPFALLYFCILDQNIE